MDQGLDSCFILQSCLYQRGYSINSATGNSHHPLFVFVKGTSFAQQLLAGIQFHQLQLPDLFSSAPRYFDKTSDSVIDKWGVLMDLMLDPVHDTDVEGYGGKSPAVLASASLTD